MGSGFWAQIVSMPQFLPCGGDRILDAQHVSVFSGEDLNRPVRAKHSIDLVSYLDIGHILASGEARHLDRFRSSCECRVSERRVHAKENGALGRSQR
jgi:hypothetical protein